VNVPTHPFDVNIGNKLKAGGQSRVGFAANDPFVRNLVLDRLWGKDEKEKGIRDKVKNYVEGARNGGNDLSEENIIQRHSVIEYDPPEPSAAMSGDQDPKKALAAFLRFCRESYPARHYLLFILGHGLVVGNDSFLFDDHAPEHSLLLTDLGEELRTFSFEIRNDDEPGELEMVGFHSCSMSGLEVAYELKGKTKYMLASQGPAFVGSWPYRPILLKVFNDLNASLSEKDLIDASSFINKLQARADGVSQFLVSQLTPSTADLLTQHNSGATPDASLLTALVKDLNKLLANPLLSQDSAFGNPSLSRAKAALNVSPLDQHNQRRLNRLLLAQACPEIAKHPVKDAEGIKDMLTKIFYYCLYNSYDFQLAGYSFDLCLSDLSKIPQVTNPLSELTQALIQGLMDKASLATELILLAHWDAQSFFQEDYVDLYDFCFCLQRRCRIASRGIENPLEAETEPGTLKKIYDACEKVREELRRGSDEVTDKLIVRSAFAGPAFQYSHGFSIFFPWAEPVDSKLWDSQYEEYELNKKTSWRDFLKVYFDETRRLPHADRRVMDDKEPVVTTFSISADLLGLLENISARVFNEEGALGKYGPDDPLTKKFGPDDPAGDSCVCPTFKNYPLFENPRETETGPEAKPNFPISPGFFGIGFLK
jgi:hypothetical protein